MRVKITTLRDVCEKLFRYLEELGIEDVDIPVDYYWNIKKDDIYNPYQKPTTLDLGQISDDWDELQKLSGGKKEPIGYFFVWLAAILRAIGEYVP